MVADAGIETVNFENMHVFLQAVFGAYEIPHG